MPRFCLKIVLAAVVGGLVSPAAADQILVYELIELEAETGGATRAYALNNTGQIVGYVESEDEKHSAYWHNRVYTDLHGTVHFDLQHPLFDVGYSQAFDISGGGQVVGTARTTIECPPTFVITNAYLLRPAVLTDLATPYPGDSLANLMTLGNPCLTAYDSVATAISNADHVVGWADRIDGVTRAFLVTPDDGRFYYDEDNDLVNDLMVDLGTLTSADPVSSATDVNDEGQITGYSYVRAGDGKSAYHAFLLTPRDSDFDGAADQWFVDGGNDVNLLMTDLGTLGGSNSWGRAINNAGQVVGESDMTTSGGEHYTRAFLWEGGTMTDLGTLRDDPNEGFSAASGINEDGVIVGWAENEAHERRAFIFKSGKMYDLNELLYVLTETGSVYVPDVVLTEARDINDDGVIVGWGTLRGMETVTRGFMLTPKMVDESVFEQIQESIDNTNDDDENGAGSGNDNDPDYDGSPSFGPGDNVVNGDDDTGGTDGDGGVSPPPAAPPAFCGAGSLAAVPWTVMGLIALRRNRR